LFIVGHHRVRVPKATLSAECAQAKERAVVAIAPGDGSGSLRSEPAVEDTRRRDYRARISDGPLGRVSRPSSTFEDKLSAAVCACVHSQPGITGVRATVDEVADAEPLPALPALAFPTTLEVIRIVAANATVTFGGNRYSTRPGLTGVELALRHRLNRGTVEIRLPAGVLVVARRMAGRSRGDRAHRRSPWRPSRPLLLRGAHR
jgi:hypothetical protein